MDALFGLPPHLRLRLAQALESGVLRLPTSPAALRAVTSLNEHADDVANALNALADEGLSAATCSRLLTALDRAIKPTRRPDLVWSGPEVPGVPARDTKHVMDELVRNAQRSIWISSYAYFDGPAQFRLLAERMDANPALRVHLLLNVPRPRHDTSSSDDLVHRFAHRFWTTDWPGDRHPIVYYDPRSLDVDGPSSVLHAKSLTIDEKAVLVTSANLTEAALNRNIEAGLLVHDPVLAQSLVRHLRGLIDHGVLHALPRA